MNKNQWAVERTFSSIKRLFGLRKGSLQRISTCARSASYGGYGA
ncbi:MAG: hypothetical protein ACMUEL_04745 [Flavobacteriales bacterium Tduv]